MSADNILEQRDPRIAYGVSCSWWGTIYEVGSNKAHLPCCPCCGGMLMEMPNEAEWYRGVDNYDKRTKQQGNYRKFIEWLRGKCFNQDHNRSFFWVAIQAFQEETGVVLKIGGQRAKQADGVDSGNNPRRN